MFRRIWNIVSYGVYILHVLEIIQKHFNVMHREGVALGDAVFQSRASLNHALDMQTEVKVISLSC